MGLEVRAGVVGLGRMGVRHLQAYRRIGIDVAAVCDVRDAALQAAADLVPGARAYQSVEAMLDRERLDVLSIVTPAVARAEVTLLAARRGVPRLLCEKPLSTSVFAGRAMLEACRAHGVRVAVNHSRRWSTGYRSLREVLTGGAIGEVRHIWVSCGGGLFACNGSHYLDLMRMLTGDEPISAVGRVDETNTPNPRGAEFRDPGAVAVYWFRSGTRAVIDMYEDLGVSPKIVIVGTVGRVEIEEVEGRWRLLTRRARDRRKPAGHYWLPLRSGRLHADRLDTVELTAAAMQELLQDERVSCSAEDGLASLQMVLAAHVSWQQEGRPVSLPLPSEFERLEIPFA